MTKSFEIKRKPAMKLPNVFYTRFFLILKVFSQQEKVKEWYNSLSNSIFSFVAKRCLIAAVSDIAGERKYLNFASQKVPDSVSSDVKKPLKIQCRV